MPDVMRFSADTREFSRALRRLSSISQRTGAELLQRAARSTLSNEQGSGLLQITPPASGGSSAGTARRAGESAIDRDLSAVFVPVKLKHQRRERWPDVAGIHADRFYSTSRFNNRLTRGQSSAYYVDVTKLRALRRELFSHVGKLASGWVAACDALHVAVPSWIRRHGARRGRAELQLHGRNQLIELRAYAPPHAPVDEITRRVPYAIKYATGRLNREADYLMARGIRAAGFSVK